MPSVKMELMVPTGKCVPQIPLKPAPRLADLNGKRIGLLWNGKKNGDMVLERMAQVLEERFAGLQCVRLKSGAELPWGAYPDEETIAEITQKEKCDAIIGSIGD